MKNYLIACILSFIVPCFALASPVDDAIIGAWELDHALTKKLAKTEIDPLPERQTDYFVYSENGSILDVSVKRKVGDNKDNVCHFLMNLEGKVTTEHCMSKGKEVIDQIITKRVNANSYQLINGNPNSEVWSGSLEVSKDGQQLTFAFDISNRKKYFRVLRRKPGFF